MAEYINLDTPLEMYRLRGNQREPISTTLRELLDFNKIPYTAADVAPVRHGRWMLMEYPYGQKTYICSECKDDDWWNRRYAYGDERYCPNCGAKMDGGD